MLLSPFNILIIYQVINNYYIREVIIESIDSLVVRSCNIYFNNINSGI